MLKFWVFAAFAVVVVVAVDVSSRPKKCTPGTTYKKDCNTCTCGATPRADKCSKIDCKRSGSTGSTTPRTPSSSRPGVCPTKVTPRPGIDDCSRRRQSNQCTVDKDCPGNLTFGVMNKNREKLFPIFVPFGDMKTCISPNGAKKCCENGCSVKLCRNAIYKNTP